ncbi:flagellar filament capping protein FliD [Alteribacillus bidgolensis]|uniref:Flagellar hook-associated protein 2 n=1 Tax=Alteribacillus bidgolensis TaxID=930129 RepID=A0A1G8E3D9_9BACI|nr:flagellar filament capping protein FliD [Alteribacillus bidgolensis]SDH64472.1 flagellar hook-associated protein 2 [Alteribacillus bidgolensis]
MQIDNRITGFASGMDINQQVRDLMQVERQPLVKMEQDALRLQYEMEGYREMNREYQSFSDSIFDGIIRRSNTTAKQAISSNENLTEIEQWEERSQSGYLRRDDLLTNGLDTMRRNMYDEVDTGEGAAFSQLTEIGITTSSNYMDRGKLEVDETELEQAIQEDSEAVYQLFSADGESYEEKGVARRVRESLDHTMDSISERAGGPAMPSPDQFTIGREMNNLDDRMSNFERRMQKTEERYWDQFTRMEQAMAEANAQARQMQQQMAGMGGMM